MNVGNKRILIFGDSLTHPGADSDPEQSLVTGPSTRASSAPGDLLGSLLLEAGASAVMIDANVGRSASNFWAGTSSHQFHSASDLIASDQAFAPDIVIVMLGTNDIGTNPITDQQGMQAIHDSFPTSDVWAIGPMTYVAPGDGLNAGAQAVFDMMTSVFGAERTIDARPLAALTGRAGDGVHFGQQAAYQTALALSGALLTASGVSTTTTVMWGLAGFGALLVGGLLLAKYLGRRSQLKGLESGEIDLDDEDFGSDPFFAKIKRDKAERLERVREAFNHSPAIIVKDKSGRETLLIKSGETANPSEGAYRVSSFAHDGPIGHVTRKTPEVLYEEIASDFYPVDARPAFDEEVMEWTSTREFERGAERVAAVQRANARGHVEEVAVVEVIKTDLKSAGDLRVGQRFDHFGQTYEVIKIFRDKEQTVQIARRSRDAFGKEQLIDHRTFPARTFDRQHLKPIDTDLGVVMPKISTKDPKAMTPAQINKELDRLDTEDSSYTDEMITEGRGHERPTDYQHKTDPLSLAMRQNYDRRSDLRLEISNRMGYGTSSGAPRRFPDGWRAGRKKLYGLKDLGAKKRESQEMKELRATREQLLSAMGYAGNTDEQVRNYHKRLDEVDAKIKRSASSQAALQPRGP